MNERRLTETLRTIGDEVTVPPLPTDLWRSGRRRRRRRLAAATCLAGLLAAAVAVPVLHGPPGLDAVPPAEPAPAVPSEVYAPLPLQRTVRQAPAGPAALIVSGGAGTLRGSDALGGYEGRTLVVGLDGRYRLVNGAHEGEVGENFHLSPDGRTLAATGPVDGSEQAAFDSTTLVDLSTGRNRTYPDGSPLGWAPDGRHLLVRPASGGLKLLDTRSGQPARPLGLSTADRTRVAFSPDGSRLAVEVDAVLHILDLVSGTRATTSLDPGDRLAGSGAWTADGRIAVWELLAGCEQGCDSPMPDVGAFRLTLLDPGPGGGRQNLGAAEVHGRTPWLLGWRRDGSAVVQTYRPAPGVAAPVPSEQAETRVVALSPSGGQTVLIELPRSAHRVDIARHLITADRFGEPPPSSWARLADWLAGVAQRSVPIVALLAGLLIFRWLRRHGVRRRGVRWRRRPGRHWWPLPAGWREATPWRSRTTDDERRGRIADDERRGRVTGDAPETADPADRYRLH